MFEKSRHSKNIVRTPFKRRWTTAHDSLLIRLFLTRLPHMQLKHKRSSSKHDFNFQVILLVSQADAGNRARAVIRRWQSAHCTRNKTTT